MNALHDRSPRPLAVTVSHSALSFPPLRRPSDPLSRLELCNPPHQPARLSTAPLTPPAHRPSTAGGLDILMAATFIIFIIAGPILRTLSLLALLLLPMPLERQRSVYLFSRRLVSYTAVECMLIATPLIGMAFGPMSEALLNDQVLPSLKLLN